MKRKLKFLLMVCVAASLSASVYGQKVTATAGTTYYTDGYQVEWTLGETAVQTMNDGPFVVTEGFHQPELLITAVPDQNATSPEISVYPNPTNDKFFISMSEVPQPKTEARLYDVTGKLISGITLQSDHTAISMASLPAGMYSLTVTVGNNEKYQFKIIKTLK